MPCYLGDYLVCSIIPGNGEHLSRIQDPGGEQLQVSWPLKTTWSRGKRQILQFEQPAHAPVEIGQKMVADDESCRFS